MKKKFLILTSTLLISQASQAEVKDLIKHFDTLAESHSIVQPRKGNFKHQVPTITQEKKTWGGVVSSPLRDHAALPFSAKLNYFKNICGEVAAQPAQPLVTKPKKKVTFSEFKPEVHEFEIEQDNTMFNRSRNHGTQTKQTNFNRTFLAVTDVGVDTPIYQGQIEIIENDIKRQSTNYDQGIMSVVKQYNKGLQESGKNDKGWIAPYKIFQEEFLQQIEDKDSSEQALESVLSEGFLEDMAQEARKAYKPPVNTTVLLPLIKSGDFIGGLNAQRDLTNYLDGSDQQINAQLLRFFEALSLDEIQGAIINFIVTNNQSEYPEYLVAKLQGDPNYMTIDPAATVKLPTAVIVYGEMPIEEDGAF